MKAFKTILIIIGSITVVGGLALFVFLNTASNETKEQLFKDTIFEEAGIDRTIYVKCEILNSRKNLVGNKWVINGKLYATSDKQNYTSETVQFNFSDGNEQRRFNFRLNGSQSLARPFQVRIEGHKNASFYGAEVIEAE